MSLKIVLSLSMIWSVAEASALDAYRFSDTWCENGRTPAAEVERAFRGGEEVSISTDLTELVSADGTKYTLTPLGKRKLLALSAGHGADPQNFFVELDESEKPARVYAQDTGAATCEGGLVVSPIRAL